MEDNLSRHLSEKIGQTNGVCIYIHTICPIFEWSHLGFFVFCVERVLGCLNVV